MGEPKLVVIMGVGRGLGSALAKRFAAGGHPVALGARSTTQSTKIAEDINATGGKAQAFVVDALDPGAVTRLFDDAEAAFGPVGLTIFNIGGRSLKAFLEVDAAEMEETWRTGFFAAFLTAQEAARRMLPRGEGSIFFTGAPSSRVGMAKHAAYAAAKFGVRGMAESMAREFFPMGIHVAHFTLDGGVGNETRVKGNPELAAQDGLLSITALAEAYYQTHLQPRSCWSFDVEMRPWNRRF